jgi:hypothetical protein
MPRSGHHVDIVEIVLVEPPERLLHHQRDLRSTLREKRHIAGELDAVAVALLALDEKASALERLAVPLRDRRERAVRGFAPFGSHLIIRPPFGQTAKREQREPAIVAIVRIARPERNRPVEITQRPRRIVERGERHRPRNQERRTLRSEFLGPIQRDEALLPRPARLSASPRTSWPVGASGARRTASSAAARASSYRFSFDSTAARRACPSARSG